MGKLKGFMLKKFFLYSFLFSSMLFSQAVLADKVELDVFAKKAEAASSFTEIDALTLNGERLSITTELENKKLDSKLFWDKLEQKKLEPADELKFLKSVFSDLSVTLNVPARENEKPVITEKVSGSFHADLDFEKLKVLYDQVTGNLEETKLKSFYILADINIDSSMSWEDLGVTKAESFSGVIVESWKKMIQKDVKGFENITALEKDFATKPDYMNSKSVTMKWNSTFKKVSYNEQNKLAGYELNAQYVLVNTKTNTILTAFDFPVQKRDLDTKNKKVLSSTLASLVYNLLLSQSAKIQEAIEQQGTNELTHFELKISNGSLSDVYAANAILQEKLKEFKATSAVKSYSSAESILKVNADGNLEKILDKLSLEGGKLPLNEQKILLFNRSDKSFAILPKDSNN
jgi:hypothetical protein